MLIATRQGMVKERTALASRIRAFLLERGLPFPRDIGLRHSPFGGSGRLGQYADPCHPHADPDASGRDPSSFGNDRTLRNDDEDA